MTGILDTSALIGLTKPQDKWQPWAQEQFNLLKNMGPVILLDIVYAETCAGMNSQHAMDTALVGLGLQRYTNRDEAMFMASRAMLIYRDNRKKSKAPDEEWAKRVLPDMLIGAVAVFEDIPLLTANERDFRKYFPGIKLIVPPATLRAK